MKKHAPRIAFVGDLTVDRYIEQKEIHLGGSSLTSSIWAKRLGVQSSIIAAVGSDKAGKKYINMLTREYVDQSHLTVIPGKSSAIDILTSKDGEREYGVWDPGVLKHFHIGKLDTDFLKKQDAVSLVVYDKTVHLLDELAALWRRWHRRKPLRVVDFGDMSQFHKDSLFVETYTDAFDILFFGLNKDDDEELINNLQRLARTYKKLIVVTLGKYGSIAFHRSRVFTQIGYDVSVVDATGAGDSFLAGFLVKYFQTHDIQKSLINGTDLASRVIQHLGGY